MSVPAAVLSADLFACSDLLYMSPLGSSKAILVLVSRLCSFETIVEFTCDYTSTAVQQNTASSWLYLTSKRLRVSLKFPLHLNKLWYSNLAHHLTIDCLLDQTWFDTWNIYTQV